MTATIQFSQEQIAAAQKEIREWFSGKSNEALRKTLRQQLSSQLDDIAGHENDVYHPVRVKLGYGILFLNGSGDERTQNFNADVNKALGL